MRFDGDHWYPGPHGLPIIKDVTSWMIGRIVERFPVHNNAVVVVQIEQGELGDDDSAAAVSRAHLLRAGRSRLTLGARSAPAATQLRQFGPSSPFSSP